MWSSQDSLGGNSRTVMIAHISPASLAFEDSRNTLTYADRAKSIRTRVSLLISNVSYFHKPLMWGATDISLKHVFVFASLLVFCFKHLELEKLTVNSVSVFPGEKKPVECVLSHRPVHQHYFRPPQRDSETEEKDSRSGQQTAEPRQDRHPSRSR